MSDWYELLDELQRRLRVDFTDGYGPLLQFAELPADLLSVRYYGTLYEENGQELLSALAVPNVAERLMWLEIDGPDEGANGVRNWELGPLVRGEAAFPNLRRLRLGLTEPHHHNLSIVTGDDEYAENGVLARLLDRCPELRELAMPSAPGAAFFQRNAHPLQTLTVQAGLDPQDFVANLARSDCFPFLASLDYTDYAAVDAEDHRVRCATFDEFAALLGQPAMARVHVVLRNTRLTAEEFARLATFRPFGNLLCVQTERRYVRPNR